MERQGINKAYLQEAHPEQGTRQQPGKDSSNPCDAKGNPSHFTRNESTVAHEHFDVQENRELQLGSNGYQSNGFDPKIMKDTSVVPVRGNKSTVADKGGYQGK